jgi:3-deoxy-D-manno-octulosonic-acid transferase
MQTKFLFIRFYSNLLELSRLLIFPFAIKMKKASSWGLIERCKLPLCKNSFSGKPTVWIHAASIGESKLMIKFLNFLRKKHPDSLYVLTAATRAGVDYLNGIVSDDILAVGFFPLDTIRLMKKMISTYAISRVWLMETEIWPSMMFMCMQTGIPVGVANARLEKKSFAAYSRIGFFCRPIFNYFDIVLAQNEAYATRFKSLGVRSDAIHIVGNIKGLIEIKPASDRRRQLLRDAMKINNTDIVLTAGCLHAGEGKIIKEALNILQQRSLRIKCIVIPRHLNDTQTILKELSPDTLYLSETKVSSSWEICIVDKMGILEDMYAVADICVVGGTFVSIGGHNVWDAAQFAIPVFFGPDYHTQKESCELLLSARVGFMVNSSNELANGITEVLKTDYGVFSSALSALIALINKRLQKIEGLIP